MELVYTIEYGYIDSEDNYFCENELNFISKIDYYNQIKILIEKAMYNTENKQYYYIEGYEDEIELTEEDFRLLSRYKSLVDCSPKNKMIQSYIIKNYTEVE